MEFYIHRIAKRMLVLDGSHSNSRILFYVKLFFIKNPALIEFDVLRLDSAKNSRKIRWKIAFVRQRQVYMSLMKILGAENSMYILQMLFENLVSPAEKSDKLPSVFQNSHLFLPYKLFIWSNYWRYSLKCTAASENSKFPTPLCLNCKCLNYMKTFHWKEYEELLVTCRI